MRRQPPDWFKEKGYLHLSPSLQLGENWLSFVKKIENPKFIAKYAFYPLLHTFIQDRKYKKGNIQKHTTDKRKHTHRDLISNKPIRNAKLRPLHYASHFDALVYGYYAFQLKEAYEIELGKKRFLDEAIIAYRKIEIETGSGKGKANMHFAKECFDEIKKRSSDEEVAVLAIDLKSFFSTLDHSYLKQQWAKLIGKEELPADHYNVFKSCTKFKYVLKDDLRIGANNRNGRKKPFDESKLANIRKNKGYRCFFETNEELRKAIAEGNLPIYSNQFYRKVENKDQSKFPDRKINIGIPQGLAISAVLANIYLLEFDNEILDFITDTYNGFYRRYSDDILVICSKENIAEIEAFAYKLIEKFKIKISKEKTERFIFKNVRFNKNEYDKRLTCFSLDNQGNEKLSSLTYLGFEFKGYHVGIKSPNLAKYYRKLISSVKRKAKRANKLADKNPHSQRAVFKNQIKKIYNLPLRFTDKENIEFTKLQRRRYKLILNDRGFYEFKHSTISNKNKSNYRSYIKRCCETFETDSFNKQIKKSKVIVHQAMNRHLNV